MDQTDALVKLYGTGEPVQVLRQVSVGPLSFLFSTDGLRRISWHGTELVRALAWPIRDENWGTHPVEILDETIADGPNFDASVTFAVDDRRLICQLRLGATALGDLSADLTMTPQGGTFSTNRAGFTVLHPIKGFAGAALDVTHADGTSQATTFPMLIQPDQPVKDIVGLCYGHGHHRVDIAFTGEVFEMEDQRNWSDASYKTYCVPLVHPFTYDLTGPTHQSIHITFSGDAAMARAKASSSGIRAELSAETAPDIGLALEGGWLPKSPETAPGPIIDAAHVLLRTSPGDQNLAQVCAVARRYPAVDLEVVLPDDMQVGDGVRHVAQTLSDHGIAPTRVTALRKAYLSSHQPSGPWPTGPAPNDMLDAVRAAFPGAAVGGGMMTNFTELNRCRPDTARCDFITHGLTPLVHAGDDLSVLETLEALPQIFASAQALSNGRPYRLGLASIGMRSNPYGAAVAENPAQVRRTMARIDPRHRGLFGAAFATGVLAATAGSAVQALCLGAPSGPFGLAYERGNDPKPGYDDQPQRRVYPLFHVVCAAAAMARHPRLTLTGLPERLIGYGARVDGQDLMLIANVSDRPQRAALVSPARVLRLDTQSFDAASALPTWLDTAQRSEDQAFDMPPFSVAFLEQEAAHQDI